MNLNLSTFEDLIRENSALQIENTYLQSRINILEIEKASLIAENSSLIEKFNEYMYLHPNRVGVKSGKAYEIKQSITENQKCNNPNKSLHNKRKPGGQPGHKGHSRKKPEYITRTEIVDPTLCPHCGNLNYFVELE